VACFDGQEPRRGNCSRPQGDGGAKRQHEEGRRNARLVSKFPMVKVPILLYPFEYVKGKVVPYNKQYYAWTLNVRYGNEYMEYMHKKFKLNYRQNERF